LRRRGVASSQVGRVLRGIAPHYRRESKNQTRGRSFYRDRKKKKLGTGVRLPEGPCVEKREGPPEKEELDADSPPWSTIQV